MDLMYANIAMQIETVSLRYNCIVSFSSTATAWLIGRSIPAKKLARIGQKRCSVFFNRRLSISTLESFNTNSSRNLVEEET